MKREEKEVDCNARGKHCLSRLLEEKEKGRRDERGRREMEGRRKAK